MSSHEGTRHGPERHNRETQNQSRDQPTRTAAATISFNRPLHPDLFSSIAQASAKDVARASDQTRNKSTQLRRFYDEICLWDQRVRQNPGKFDEYLPFIRMLNAKVAYAEGRKLVDRTYVEIFHLTLSQVKDPDSLAACKLFWEAFTGFYKQLENAR